MATVYKLHREPSAKPQRKPRARSAARERKGALTKPQLARICIIANEAAAAHGITGWREVAAWRREQQRERFGLASLTAATQDQYADIKGHFQALAGNAAEAYETIRRGLDKRRVARWNLDKALREANLALPYAVAICRTQYRTALEDASAKQLWALVFTIRNRAAAKRRKSGNSSPPKYSENIPATPADPDAEGGYPF